MDVNRHRVQFTMGFKIPATSHRQALSHNVVSSTPHLSGVQTHNVSGDQTQKCKHHVYFVIIGQ
jgi:hypothetical protein